MQIKIDDFEKILKCWKILYKLDDEIYLRILREIQPDLNLNPEKTYAYIIRFLQIWGVRSAANISPEHLCSKIQDLKPQLLQLNIDLLNANLDSLNKQIRDVFDQIKAVRHVGPTSASKILHILVPRLFVMWDGEIARNYRVSTDSQGYVEFLRKSQNLLMSLMRQYRSLGIAQPELELVNKYGKPLTKLLDEYNWLSIRIPVLKNIELMC